MVINRTAAALQQYPTPLVLSFEHRDSKTHCLHPGVPVLTWLTYLELPYISRAFGISANY